MTDDDRPHVLLYVSLVIQIGPIECLLMSLDAIFLVILETNLSEHSKGGVVEIMLAVDVEERLWFGCESSSGDHLCSIECFAHGYLLKVFYVVVEDELVFSGGKDCAAEVLDLYHLRLLKIMRMEATC